VRLMYFVNFYLESIFAAVAAFTVCILKENWREQNLITEFTWDRTKRSYFSPEKILSVTQGIVFFALIFSALTIAFTYATSIVFSALGHHLLK
jgi:hypothetical protein